MITTLESNHILMVRMPSDMSLLPSVTRRCMLFLRNLGLGFCPDVALVSRELLSNAICHGNRRCMQKQVHLEIRKLDSGEIEVLVEDEGAGFNYRRLNLSVPEEKWWGGHHGLALVNMLTNGLAFNAMGNQVTVRLAVSGL